MSGKVHNMSCMAIIASMGMFENDEVVRIKKAHADKLDC